MIDSGLVKTSLKELKETHSPGTDIGGDTKCGRQEEGGQKEKIILASTLLVRGATFFAKKTTLHSSHLHLLIGRVTIGVDTRPDL